MSLPHAILTSLAERPGSGSELARRFDRSIGHFWQATHQQIYRELARLEASAWVEATAVEGAPGRKRRYRILPAGRQELERWTGAALAPPAIRDELMVRLRAAGEVDPGDLTHELDRLLNHHRAQLATYEAVRERDFPHPPASRTGLLQLLVLNEGIAFERQRIAFCEAALALLRNR